jgi:hypothetical protein
VVEVGPGDIDTAALSAAQSAAERGLLAQAMVGYIRWLAKWADGDDLYHYLAERQRLLRDIGHGEHTRTPANAASLMLGIETFLHFAVDTRAISQAEVDAHQHAAWEALMGLADAQASFMTNERPAQRFLLLVAAALSSGRVHVTTLEGHAPDNHRQTLGWRETDSFNSRWEPQGDRIGWVSGDDLFLNPEAAYATAQQLARTGMRPLTIKQETLGKRLDEAGMLVTKDPKRHTTRISVAGVRQRVFHLRTSALGSGEE